MKVLLGYSEHVAEWVAQRVPYIACGADFGPCAAIAVIAPDTSIAAGIVYHAFRQFETPSGIQSTIEISIASDSPRWGTRGVINSIMAYPFDQLGCVRVGTTTPARNKAALSYLQHFGFKREAVLRRAFGNQDAVISSMLAKEWRSHRMRSDMRAEQLILEAA